MSLLACSLMMGVISSSDCHPANKDTTLGTALAYEAVNSLLKTDRTVLCLAARRSSRRSTMQPIFNLLVCVILFSQLITTTAIGPQEIIKQREYDNQTRGILARKFQCFTKTVEMLYSGSIPSHLVIITPAERILHGLSRLSTFAESLQIMDASSCSKLNENFGASASNLVIAALDFSGITDCLRYMVIDETLMRTLAQVERVLLMPWNSEPALGIRQLMNPLSRAVGGSTKLQAISQEILSHHQAPRCLLTFFEPVCPTTSNECAVSKAFYLNRPLPLIMEAPDRWSLSGAQLNTTNMQFYRNFRVAGNNSDGSLVYEGYDYMLVKEIAHRLNFTFNVLPQFATGIPGTRLPNGTGTGLVGGYMHRSQG